MKALILSSLGVLLVSAPAAAQLGNTVNEPAPGYPSLLGANYANAEREIRSSQVSPYDPARAINLGIALAKTGRSDEAAKEFRSVLLENDVEMVVANGATVMSHDLARRALAGLQDGTFNR
jgi:Flp pilus assembly protein TadD